jgi:thiol-disulfide isomerase/thioredoxin
MVQFIHVNNDNSLKDFNENKNKVKLVKYYMDGCSHCDRLKPIWKLIEEKMEKEFQPSDILVTQLNADFMKNAIVPNVNGFPTISIIKNDDKIDYNGDRNVDDIMKFCYENLSQIGGKKKSYRKKTFKKNNRKKTFKKKTFRKKTFRKMKMRNKLTRKKR